MTSNQHGPYVRGYTRVTMGGTEGRYHVSGCQSPKPVSYTHLIMEKAPSSLHTLIASGDVYIRAGQPLQTIPDADVVCFVPC